ncbi:DinB family protein [Kitasatospora sp. NPDC048365]|uniref:DinB family protein n=1 Tax=Kitasatospora sp. NPDC048365 TaxID=3364050 RepID=UPI00370FF997
MTWTAPEITRPDGSLSAPEGEMLPGYLAFHRATLLHKCAGLTGEQLAVAPLPDSNLTLLGLVRHMAKVERTWFRIRFSALPVEPLHFVEGRKDADFELLDPARAEEDYDRLVEEVRLADEAVAGVSMDTTFDLDGEAMSLRMIHLHMIGEYARHNGHADLVRQHLDGTTGA